MNKCLVGFSGFVGSSLLKQTSFESLYRSENIHYLGEQFFDTVLCAAAPAQKWIANCDPLSDLNNIQRLMSHLQKLSCANFILISTVDVFKDPSGVDEDTPVEEEGLHAYGLHRRLLERFVENHFPRSLIVRLPGLVGPGLRKNIVFDFLNDNNLQSIDSRGIFQFYPMVNLWWDIQRALHADLTLVHLTAEPISVSEVAEFGFGTPFFQHLINSVTHYDVRTRHAELFEHEGLYQYSQRDTLLAIRAYAQSEPKTKLNKAEDCV